MITLKGFLALGLFLLFFPLFLFSVGTILVLFWATISFILHFIIPVLVFSFLVIVFISFILVINENRKNKKFRENFKTYKYNRVPSQLYLYK